MHHKKIDWNFHFSLDGDNGILYWKEKPRHYFKNNKQFVVWNKRFPGKQAGSISQKTSGARCSFVIDKKSYSRSRIVWEMTNGQIPKGLVIDHINGNTLDDRPVNLRIASKSQNTQNSKTKNMFGVKGVIYYKKQSKYGASITRSGRVVFLGLFLTKGLAAVAYAKASLKIHGVFSYYYRRRHFEIFGMLPKPNAENQ